MEWAGAFRVQAQVEPQRSGVTVEQILSRELGMSGAAIIRAAARPDGVLRNGVPVRRVDRVCGGDVICADVSDPPVVLPPLMPFPADVPVPRILREDEMLLVLEKPAGMEMYPTADREAATLQDWVCQYLQGQFHPVNRLDRGTGGLLIAAKCGYIHALLCKQRLHRRYLAVTDGVPNPPEGEICTPIARAGAIVRTVADEGAPAQTRYRVLQTGHSRALVEVFPITGRTHQIRVHMAHIGCPLTGDFLYGREQPELLHHPALYAAGLKFVHPITNEIIELDMALPALLRRLLQ